MAPADLSPLERVRATLATLGAARSEGAALLLLGAGAVLLAGLVAWGQLAPGPGDMPPVMEEVAAGPALTMAEGDPLVVHVAGLVRSPGVHRLPPGARVADALEAAGGALPDAWLDALNLARPLADGEQLLVLPRDAEGTPAGSGGNDAPAGVGGGAGIRPDGRVDLNRASVAELETLPGVGPVLAQRLVEHREAHGPFTEVGQLRDVRGIGEKTFQSLAELVAV
jgi:competence protein ComEA